jgi:hypothetical protein
MVIHARVHVICHQASHSSRPTHFARRDGVSDREMPGLARGPRAPRGLD